MSLEPTEFEPYLALDDFAAWFHDDVLDYHASQIAEFLNNIRWAVYEYLQPERRRRAIPQAGARRIRPHLITNAGRGTLWQPPTSPLRAQRAGGQSASLRGRAGAHPAPSARLRAIQRADPAAAPSSDHPRPAAPQAGVQPAIPPPPDPSMRFTPHRFRSRISDLPQHPRVDTASPTRHPPPCQPPRPPLKGQPSPGPTPLEAARP